MRPSLVPPCQPCSQTTRSGTTPTCVTASHTWCLSSGWDFDVFQIITIRHHYIPIIMSWSFSFVWSRLHFQLPGRKQMAALGSESSGMESCSLESAQQFLQESLARVSILQNLDSPGAQDLLDFTIRSKNTGLHSVAIFYEADVCW